MKEFINFNKLQYEIGQALLESCKEFVEDDIKPVTPKDTGLLRESIKVTQESDTEVIIYVENDDAGYGKYVHEMPPETKWTTEGTSNKFLERPLMISGHKIFTKVAWRTGKHLQGVFNVSNYKLGG